MAENNKGGTILILIILALLVFFLFKGCGITPPSEGCYDSDGLDYKNKGYTTFNGSSQIWDSCSGNSIVIEQYCGNDTQESQTYDCSNFGTNWTCSDGRCIKSGNGGGGGDGELPKFEVNITKDLQATYQLFTIVDGQTGVNQIAMRVTFTNTGDVDFTDIEVFNADAVSQTQEGSNIGTCNKSGFINALAEGGLWGSQGPLAVGQSITKESGKMLAEDCRGGLDLNEVAFFVGTWGYYGIAKQEKWGITIPPIKFEEESGTTFGCDWSSPTIVFQEIVDSEVYQDTSGRCSTTESCRNEYDFPSSNSYCYKIVYTPAGYPTINIDGYEWSNVDVFAWIEPSNTWTELDNFDCGDAEEQDGGDDNPIMSHETSGLCLSQCGVSFPNQGYPVNYLGYNGILYCTPTITDCNKIGEYRFNCGIGCYGIQNMELGMTLSVMKEGGCWRDRVDWGASCSTSRYALFYSPEFTVTIYQYPYT